MFLSMQKNNLRLLLTSFFIILSGCNVQSPKTIESVNQLPVINRWWLHFNEPIMNAQVNILLQQNIDKKIAQVRINEARAATDVAVAEFFPNIPFIGFVSKGNNQIGIAKRVSIANGGFDASWEIDLFGRVRAASYAAEANQATFQAQSYVVVNSLIAELAKAFINLDSANYTIKVLEQLITNQNDQVSLFRSRSQAGLIDETYLTRAEALLNQTKARLPIAIALRNNACYQIAQLLGKNPESMQAVLQQSRSRFDVPNSKTTLSIPIKTIMSRPDVQAASQALFAAKYELMLAEANRWPRLSIGGYYGYQDGSSNLPLAANPISALSGNILFPAFNFNRLKSIVNLNEAHTQKAFYEYQRTILIALQESYTSLNNYLQGLATIKADTATLKKRRLTVHLAIERFQKGLSDMTDLTTAQTELNEAELRLIESKKQTAIAYIELQKALGVSVRSL